MGQPGHGRSRLSVHRADNEMERKLQLMHVEHHSANLVRRPRAEYDGR